MSLPTPKPKSSTVGFFSEAPMTAELKPEIITCDVCRAGVELPRDYTDAATCAECGSFYDYDEGFALRLSDAQLETLRRHADEWK